jgi:hypothetical protein
MKRMTFLLAVALFIASPCFAMCLSEDVKEAYSQSAQVFIGEVLDVKVEGKQAKIIFRVEKVYKGEETEETVIFQPAVFYREDMWVEDSISFVLRGKYLVYATQENGQLTVGSCSRTRTLDNAPPDVAIDLSALERMREATR